MIKISATAAGLLLIASTAQADYYKMAPLPTAATVAECTNDAIRLGQGNNKPRLEACRTNPLYMMCLTELTGRRADPSTEKVAYAVRACRQDIGYAPGEYELEQKLERDAVRNRQDAYNRANPPPTPEQIEAQRQRDEQNRRNMAAEDARRTAMQDRRETERATEMNDHARSKFAQEIVDANNSRDEYQRILVQCQQEEALLRKQEEQRTGVEIKRPVRDPCRIKLDSLVIQKYNAANPQDAYKGR